MPSRNRGKESNDDKLFAPKWLPILKDAVDDLCHLFSRGYAENSAIQLVGNRYKLNKRQRHAIRRISSSQEEIKKRRQSMLSANALVGKPVYIDGFNLLILLESALSGAYVFKGRDGTYRDISSVHGSYKRVHKTENAILAIGQTLKELQVSSTHWFLDKPVSNSGRLKTWLVELCEQHQFNWEVSLVFNPDKELAESGQIVVSTDGWILDQAQHWFNLGAYLLEQKFPEANIITV